MCKTLRFAGFKALASKGSGRYGAVPLRAVSRIHIRVPLRAPFKDLFGPFTASAWFYLVAEKAPPKKKLTSSSMGIPLTNCKVYSLSY